MIASSYSYGLLSEEDEGMNTREKNLEYNEVARSKGLVDKFVENSDKDLVVSFCEDSGLSGKDILDVGCATGDIASVLHCKVGGSGLWWSYTGVDIDKVYLRSFADRNIPESDTKVGDATKLPVEDGTKDVVLLLFVLQHLTKKEGREAIAELKRVARPGASVIIAATVHPTECTKERPYAASELKNAGAPEIPTTTWNMDELVDVVEKSELKVEKRHQEDSQQKPLIKLYLRARNLTVTG
jgi:ubiquinone/menaquinone biosynthesis C-methylase UbiE